MRRSFVLLVSVVATLVACSEPVGPYIPHEAGSSVSNSDLMLRGVVEMTHDVEPRVALRMSEILVVLRVSEGAKANLTAAIGATATVSGNFRSGEFVVSSYEIFAVE